MIELQENAWTEGRMEGQDGQTLFYRTFPATPRVQKLSDIKTYRWTQKQRKKIKKPTLSLVNAGPPDRASVLSTKYEGCHPKGPIVASSYKVKQNNNNNISFARQEQKSTETLIFILLS